jgi:hypothetical protein
MSLSAEFKLRGSTSLKIDFQAFVVQVKGVTSLAFELQVMSLEKYSSRFTLELLYITLKPKGPKDLLWWLHGLSAG